MPGSSFGTTPEELNQTAQQIEQVSSSIQSELSKLMGQVEPIASSWKGGASQAFQQLMQRWSEDANKLTQALNAISEMMTSSSKNYSQVEESNSSQIQGILGSLG